MEYNTTNEKLALPEYGRNIQRMAQYCMSIEDREQRNSAANEIINIMGSMFPQIRDQRDYKQKFWDHLALMTDYQLDVDYPFPIERIQDKMREIEPLPYNTNRIKFRHYGRTTERMIAKAIELKDSDEKKTMVMLIANHMKKQYLAWNKNSVNDEIIKNDLERLSEGLLSLDEDTKLGNYRMNPNQNQNQNQSNSGRQNNRRNNNTNRRFKKNNTRN